MNGSTNDMKSDVSAVNKNWMKERLSFESKKRIELKRVVYAWLNVPNERTVRVLVKIHKVKGCVRRGGVRIGE